MELVGALLDRDSDSGGYRMDTLEVDRALDGMVRDRVWAIWVEHTLLV